jgi:ABC-type phosphate transport system substrate-binding protein
MNMTFLRTLALVAVSCGTVSAQCAAGSLVVVVNKSNPTESLSMAQLRKLMMGDVHSWPDQKKVTLIARDTSSPVYKCVLSAVVRMSESEYRRYILNAEFRGEEPVSMKTADSGTTAAKAVAGSAGSIAVVEAGTLQTVGDTVKVIKINGKQPGDSGYPLS